LPDLVDLVSLLILAGVPEGPGVLGVRMRLVPGASITRSSVTDSDAISLLTAVGSVGRRAIAQPQDARPEIADEHGPLPQSGGHNLVARLLLSRRRSTDGVDPTEVQRTCSLGEIPVSAGGNRKEGCGGTISRSWKALARAEGQIFGDGVP
jgi:hypothetical protein